MNGMMIDDQMKNEKNYSEHFVELKPLISEELIVPHFSNHY